MEHETPSSDSWEHSAFDDATPPKEYSDNDGTVETAHKSHEECPENLYELYGNNEPYTESKEEYIHDEQIEMFELMIGPSTNIYVGPRRKHYTIPKRLLYRYSDYAKVCLEGNFSEADANAVFLPDVDPDVFRWLWAWLYGAGLGVNRSLESCAGWYFGWIGVTYLERETRACQLLCRLYMLGERLLFDRRFLEQAVQEELEGLAQGDLIQGLYKLLNPEIVQEVLEGSAMVKDYGPWGTWGTRSLRPYISKALCRFEFCTTVDFRNYATCFELDGGFAAEFMRCIADMTRWAFETWKKQFQLTDGLDDLRKEYKSHRDRMASGEENGQKHSRSWFALKVMCTSVEWTRDDIYEFGPLFEMDGAFASDVLNSMAAELAWFGEQWGRDRGEKIDFTAEKEFYDEMKERDDWLDYSADRYAQRWGWT